MGSIITLSIVQSALELGFIYALVALALFISFSILNIADLSTDGCFTLGSQHSLFPGLVYLMDHFSLRSVPIPANSVPVHFR